MSSPPFILLLIYIAIGISAGILGAMLGIGGGVIIVPALYAVFAAYHYYEHDLALHMAIGTSLASIIFNSLAATWIYHKLRLVCWPLFFKMAPWYLLGSIGGAILTVYLTDRILSWIFAGFLFALALYFWFKKRNDAGSFPIPAIPYLVPIGLGIGCLSNVLGVGGGTLAAPYFQLLTIPTRQSLGTSAATSLFLSFIGSIAYLIASWKIEWPMRIGYIDLDAFLVIGITSMLVAKLGVRIGQHLSMMWIRRLFSFVFIFTGLAFILLK